MAFAIVAATEWLLRVGIDPVRRQRLLEAPFEHIVTQIVSEAALGDCFIDDKINKVPGSQRACASLILPCQTVDLFHSGAGGYRAQFYLGVDQGEAANRFAIDSLLTTVKRLCECRCKEECSWARLEPSFRHRDAKLWIFEGAWLTDNQPSDQNLWVPRWEANAPGVGMEHGFEASWARLTPESETVIELKGGLLDASFQPIDAQLKTRRSQDLYDHGYT